MSNQSVGCPNYPPWVIIPSRNDTLVFINDVLIASVNSPLSLWAFIANLLVIIAVIKTPSLRIRSNVLLCSLAAADCLTGLIVQPSFICWRFALHYADCHILQTFFMVEEISFFAINGCSYVMLTPISCDRLYALARPMQYRTVVKELKGMILASVAAWVFMTVYSTLIFTEPSILYLVDIPVACFIIGIPIICHIAMFLSIRRHNQNIQDMNSAPGQQLAVSLQREKKVARTMSLIMLILLVLLLPNVVVAALKVSPLTVNVFFPWTTTLTMMTSSLNPVVHLWRNPKLREAVMSLCCVQLCATAVDIDNGKNNTNRNVTNQKPTSTNNITKSTHNLSDNNNNNNAGKNISITDDNIQNNADNSNNVDDDNNNNNNNADKDNNNNNAHNISNSNNTDDADNNNNNSNNAGKNNNTDGDSNNNKADNSNNTDDDKNNNNKASKNNNTDGDNNNNNSNNSDDDNLRTLTTTTTKC